MRGEGQLECGERARAISGCVGEHAVAAASQRERPRRSEQLGAPIELGCQLLAVLKLPAGDQRLD